MYMLDLNQVRVSTTFFYLVSAVDGLIGSLLPPLSAVVFCPYCSYLAYLVTGIIVFFNLVEDKKKNG